MAKVTSKLQLTIPKVVAEEYGIRPGDEVELASSGGFIRMTPPIRRREDLTAAERARLFRKLLERFRNRRKAQSEDRRAKARAEAERGWKREDLYTRGSPR
jgi:AbrB family looped-hinge helix DNA binding protein